MYISDFDPTEAQEGGLDPLSLAPIADRLATALAPGIRERQKHPRFLTATAVGLSLFEEIERRYDFNQAKVTPWEAFEWLLASGIVKFNRDDSSRTAGLPGVDKTRRAYDAKLPLCAQRYLKTPGTFGLHGIIKVLAVTVGVEKNDFLEEKGMELLDVWQSEQNLGGFRGNVFGPGSKFKHEFLNAIISALETGVVQEGWNWKYYSQINDHLHHRTPGKNESRFLLNLISGGEEGLRHEFLAFMQSADFKKLRRECNGQPTERMIHEQLLKTASHRMHEALIAIQKYESFARLLMNAFDGIRYELSKSHHACSFNDLSKVVSLRELAKHGSASYQEAYEALVPLREALNFSSLFGVFSECGREAELVEKIITHHESTQKRKPPGGKRSWFERYDGDRIGLRTDYRIEDFETSSQEYVHFYRAFSVQSFFRDLGVSLDG